MLLIIDLITCSSTTSLTNFNLKAYIISVTTNRQVTEGLLEESQKHFQGNLFLRDLLLLWHLLRDSYEQKSITSGPSSLRFALTIKLDI